MCLSPPLSQRYICTLTGVFPSLCLSHGDSCTVTGVSQPPPLSLSLSGRYLYTDWCLSVPPLSQGDNCKPTAISQSSIPLKHIYVQCLVSLSPLSLSGGYLHTDLCPSVQSLSPGIYQHSDWCLSVSSLSHGNICTLTGVAQSTLSLRVISVLSDLEIGQSSCKIIAVCFL